MTTLLGGIEAGGTKVICAIGTSPGNVLESASFPTTQPQETLACIRDFYIDASGRHGPLSALGIASFGPVNLDKNSDRFGYITTTPKPGWSDTNIVGYFRDAFTVPVAFETDVNGAALGEYHLGAARGCKNFVYVTVGTGIGAGVMIDGKLLNGVTHPEVGHMLMPYDASQDSFSGCCPFHNNCLEGLASGMAIEARWNCKADTLAVDHPAWNLQAHYLAMLCVNLTNFYSPEKIIFGGGVMKQAHLFPKIREQFKQTMNGYFSSQLVAETDCYIIASELDGRQGVYGALTLAEAACEG